MTPTHPCDMTSRLGRTLPCYVIMTLVLFLCGLTLTSGGIVHHDPSDIQQSFNLFNLLNNYVGPGPTPSPNFTPATIGRWKNSLQGCQMAERDLEIQRQTTAHGNVLKTGRRTPGTAVYITSAWDGWRQKTPLRRSSHAQDTGS
ncbi:hypothetical protein PoB_007453200 [Plakobranchus ocellatus]|uniref:Uncharacterized protein n=1 Tax=Plakobranchus ocellatus TaxID=259542 RepID=A0AAV4DUM9_9GAST|nr:hypothetical protein PoB_007453200 [Plakobranchus ocellatus]